MTIESKEAGNENEPEASTPSPPPASGSGNFTRFGSAVPLVPPRPSPSQGPPRPTTVPRPPPIPSNGSFPQAGEVSSAVVALREQLEAAQRALLVKDAEVRTLLAQRDAGIADIRQLRTELSVRDHQIELKKARIKDLERATEEKAARCAKLEAEVRELGARGEVGGDDLRLIRGIGKAFERELKRNGVRTFDQIAAWTEDDIEQMGNKIKARPERIKRDEWVKKAAALAAEKQKP
jgi:predicted flap endonuclease-1-like 5' DNA nuclease